MKEAPGTAPYYFEVKTNVPSENLSEITIKFDVKKSWLNDQELGSGYVRLRKLNAAWEFVPVTITDESITRGDAAYVRYSATVSSLSWFTVTGKAPAAGEFQ